MENYKLPSKEIYQILRDKGLQYLYHVNTVSTSQTFIKQNALLSRGFVEENGLVQTDQKSDNEDKLYDVWNHVFLDAIDLHSLYSRANYYGPVAFLIKLELFNSPDLPYVHITKSNPMYWKLDTPIENKFYSTVEALKADYLTGKKLASRIMFTFRDPGRRISLSAFVVSIGIDRPELLINLRSGGTKNIGDYTFDQISKTLRDSGLSDIPVYHRHTHKKGYCACNFNYTYLYNFRQKEFLKRFFPQR
nr:hypothetical protein [uncultured Flavobacterium sp.]